MPRLAAERLGDKPVRFDLEAYEKEAANYFRSKVKPEVEAGFEEMVENWDERPEFRVRITVGPNPTLATGYGIALDMWPTGDHAELFKLLSAGAPEHDIPLSPKEEGWLWYRETYEPKTSIVGGRLFTGGSGRYSGSLVKAKQVTHPGFEGRRFAFHFMESYRDRWDRHVRSILKQARRAARRAR